MTTTKCARNWRLGVGYDRHVCTGGPTCKGDCKSNGQLVDENGQLLRDVYVSSSGCRAGNTTEQEAQRLVTAGKAVRMSDGSVQIKRGLKTMDLDALFERLARQTPPNARIEPMI